MNMLAKRAISIPYCLLFDSIYIPPNNKKTFHFAHGNHSTHLITRNALCYRNFIRPRPLHMTPEGVGHLSTYAIVSYSS